MGGVEVKIKIDFLKGYFLKFGNFFNTKSSYWVQESLCKKSGFYDRNFGQNIDITAARGGWIQSGRGRLLPGTGYIGDLESGFGQNEEWPS